MTISLITDCARFMCAAASPDGEQAGERQVLEHRPDAPGSWLRGPSRR